MNIKQIENETGGTFQIEIEEEKLGELRYSWKGGNMVIEHTEVSEKLKGQGAGKILIAAAVNFARGKNVRIIPVCPFAKKVMERMPEYSDVLIT